MKRMFAFFEQTCCGARWLRCVALANALLLAGALTAAAAQRAPAPQAAAPVFSAETIAYSAATAGDPGMFPPVREKIPEPYTNDKCLKNCHGEKGFGANAAPGRREALYLDPDAFAASMHGQKNLQCIDCHPGSDPNFHPRTGYPKAQCAACHSRDPAPGTFPPDALAMLAKKGIERPPVESRNAEDYRATAHGIAHAAGRADAPTCATCHSAHAVQPAFDPRSTVNAANLLATCGACHADRIENYSVGGALARFRISGHGKGDFSNAYSPTACLSCHPEQGAHGKKAGPAPVCPTCHRPPAVEGAKAPVPFHLVADPEAGTTTSVLGLLYTGGLWAAGALVSALLLLFGVSALLPRRDDAKDKK